MHKHKSDMTLGLHMQVAEASIPYVPLLKRGSAAELCERAEYLARRNEHKEALPVLNSAISKYPKYQRAYQLKGYSLISMHRFGAALAAFRKCLSLAPQRKYYHFYLGKVYFAMRKYHLAITEYRKALNSMWPFDDKDFTNAVIYRQIGLTYISWRKPSEALWCYEKVFSSGDYFGAPLRRRALALSKKKVKARAPTWAQAPNV